MGHHSRSPTRPRGVRRGPRPVPFRAAELAVPLGLAVLGACPRGARAVDDASRSGSAAPPRARSSTTRASVLGPGAALRRDPRRSARSPASRFPRSFALGATCLPACAVVGSASVASLARSSRRSSSPPRFPTRRSTSSPPAWTPPLLQASWRARARVPRKDAAAFAIAADSSFPPVPRRRSRSSQSEARRPVAMASLSRSGLAPAPRRPRSWPPTDRRCRKRRGEEARLRMPPRHAWIRLQETILDTLVAFATPMEPALIVLLAAGTLALVLAFGRRALAHPAVLALTLFGGAYVAAFAVANPLVFSWYRPPLALATAFVTVACAARLPRPARAAVAVLLGAAASLHVAMFRRTTHRPQGSTRATSPDLGPDDTVAAPRSSALGWATKARVLDTVGPSLRSGGLDHLSAQWSDSATLLRDERERARRLSLLAPRGGGRGARPLTEIGRLPAYASETRRSAGLPAVTPDQGPGRSRKTVLPNAANPAAS